MLCQVPIKESLPRQHSHMLPWQTNKIFIILYSSSITWKRAYLLILLKNGFIQIIYMLYNQLCYLQHPWPSFYGFKLQHMQILFPSTKAQYYLNQMLYILYLIFIILWVLLILHMLYNLYRIFILLYNTFILYLLYLLYYIFVLFI